jgi:carboxyl-terminal processing protease
MKALFLWVTPAVLAAFVLGLLASDQLRAREVETFWDETIAEKVRVLVGSQYVDEIGESRGRELFYGAMQGYLRALDPYCSFYDPAERQQMEEDTSGRFGGVGILVRANPAGLEIVGLRAEDPAESAGARLGDLIVGVDGTSVRGMDLTEITDLIKGVPGTPVAIVVERDGAEIALSMFRSAIRIDSVVGVRMVDSAAGVGYFRVSSFKESTGLEARRAIEHLRRFGARSFVLDQRQNSGGVLEKGAVSLVDLFLPDGPIVQTRGRTPDSRKVYEARGETTVCPEDPVVVLVDGGSASAAEVVAGAFQDRRRGILVGERTYGKFLVQSIHRLPQTDVALSLTTAKYYTPYGRWLQRKEDTRGNVLVRGGLLPDVIVARGEEETTHLLGEVFPALHGMDMRVKDRVDPGPDSQLDRAVRLLVEYQAVTGKEGD